MDSTYTYSPIAAAFVRAGRVLVAAAISALIVALPQAVGIFELPTEYNAAIILAGTSILNGIGKYFRDTKDTTTVV